MKVSKNDFINRLNDKFEKSFEIKSEFQGLNKPLTIKCNSCNCEFTKPRSVLFLNAKKCFCNTGNVKKTFEYFENEAKQVWGDQYEYDKSTYHSFQKHTSIKCNLHDEVFEQTPYNHVVRKSQGCPKCVSEAFTEKIRMSVDEFEKQANEKHDYFYKYHGDYTTMHEKIKITCPVPDHGDFYQTPANHIKGRGCPKCGQDRTVKSLRKHWNDIKQRLENKNPNYTYPNNFNYKSQQQYIETICDKGHVFKQKIGNQLFLDHKCPLCSGKVSKPLLEIGKTLDDNNIEYEYNNRSILGSLELDLFIPDKNIAIEYNGLIFHREGLVNYSIGGGKDRNYHLNKTNLCKEKNIRLIHIFEDEYLHKKSIVISKIKHILGINIGLEKVNARSCVVKEIDNSTSNTFLVKNHIQGGDNGKVRLGLFSKKSNLLVAVMTFTYDKRKNEWKLNRYAADIAKSVRGGASKLLKSFIRLHNPKKIITFADKRWSGDKSLYNQLGFVHMYDSDPNYFYFYINDNNFFRESRQKYMKHKILKMNPQLDATKTESELMGEMGYDRIWDCGNMKFELIINN
jgi:hypothetical protein